MPVASGVEPPTLSADGTSKTYAVRGRVFEVPSHYDVAKLLGYGSYGTVCAAVDTRDGKKVAIKKVSGVFEDLIDGKRILREISVLHGLRHPNVLQLHEVVPPRDLATFSDLYIVTQLMDADLAHIIRSPQPLSERHSCYFLLQLLRALKYVHSANVVHRDVKPSNILVSETCQLVLCDFGLARTVDDIALTGYVVTRWYRAPELLVSARYSFPVDVWSVGCIFGELMQRRPLLPGANYVEQLSLIVRLLGTPSDEAFAQLPEDAQKYIHELGPTPPADFAELFPDATPVQLDFLRLTLQFDPAKRATAAELLQHPYVAKYRNPKKDFEAAEPLSLEDVEPERHSEAALRHAFVRAFERLRNDGLVRDAPTITTSERAASQIQSGPATGAEA